MNKKQGILWCALIITLLISSGCENPLTLAETIDRIVTLSQVDTSMEDPIELAASPSGPFAIYLSWTPNVPGIQTYHLQRSADSGNIWADVSSSISDSAVNYTDSGSHLSPKSEYTYRIRADFGSEYSNWSNDAAAVTSENLWQHETVRSGGPFDSGKCARCAVDNNGVLHLVFVEDEMMGRKLIYMTNTTGSFADTLIDSGYQDISFCDITLDATGIPHFSYLTTDNMSAYTICHASYDGSVSTIEIGSADNDQTAIAYANGIDGGSLIIGYTRADQFIRIRSTDGGQTFPDSYTHAYNGACTSITTNSSGSQYYFSTFNEADNLLYILSDNGWDDTLLQDESITSHAYTGGRYSDIALDPYGKMYVSCYVDSLGSGELAYMTDRDGTWNWDHPYLIDSSPDTEAIYSSIAAGLQYKSYSGDRYYYLYISYRDTSDDSLKLATFIPSAADGGSWSMENLSTCVGSTSIGFDRASDPDILHLVYRSDLHTLCHSWKYIVE